MKIKCANCNQKTISFFEGFKNRGHVNCPSCNSNLKLESNRVYRPLAFLNIILMIYIVIKTEDGNINNYLGYLICFSTFLLTLFFTTKSSISNHSITKKEKIKNSKRNAILLVIVSSIILYSWLLRNPKINQNSPIMIIWGIFTIIGSIFLLYRVIKDNKK